MEKKMIIAIGLSLLILFGFQALAPKAAKTPLPVTPFEQKSSVRQTEGTGYVKEKKELSSQEALRGEEQQEKTSEIKTDKLNLIFSDIGGSLKEIRVSDETSSGREKELVYLQEDPTKMIFSLKTGFLSGLNDVKYETQRGPGVVEYSYEEKDWLKIRKKYSAGTQDYSVIAEISIENLSSGKKEMSYTIVGPSSIQQNGNVSGRNFLEVNTLIDGKIWKLSKAKGEQERKGIAEWTAIKNRYYGLILKPEVATKAVVVKDEGQKNLLTELEFGGWALSPGAKTKQEYVFYAGPLNEKTIGKVSSDMTSVVNYGFFGGVSKVLLVVLRFFYGLTHNWGISIILLTLTVNLLLFPLAVKSFVSMHQMKKIQPHIMKLKELHKDNPQKLNKETMELYKKNNVNPLGGCLPLILQMPIFIALYQGLIRSIELKGASFLWIKDLSKPDGVPLPITLPLIGNSINILPLLMVVMMALQQKLTQASSAQGMTDEQKGQQKMMMLMMPVIFGFMFYNMPSGLVLYWLTNTILMTTGQKIISSRLEA